MKTSNNNNNENSPANAQNGHPTIEAKATQKIASG
jgi:hypothetical protein